MRTGLKILHIICFLLLLGSGDIQVRGLTVTGKDGPTEALRGEDVTIPCLLSSVPIPLNLQEVSVKWTLRLQNGTEYEVYHFKSLHHQSLRPGSQMNDSDLVQGNASLFISSIQIEDEGEYTCFVIVRPDAGTATSTLHIFAKPQATLSLLKRIESGFEESAFCEVRNFYPEAVKIQWVKYSKRYRTNSSLDKDVFFTTPFRNSDGTFNMTSLFLLRLSSEAEAGDIFSCVVSHRSLEKEIAVRFTIARMRLAIYICLAFLALNGILVLTVLLKVLFRIGWRLWISVFCIALIIPSIPLFCYYVYLLSDFKETKKWIQFTYPVGIMFYLAAISYFAMGIWRYFKEGNLTVSEISGDPCIPHMKRTTLTCQITNFIQREIQIHLYLKRRTDIEKHLIAYWETDRSTDRISSNNSSNGRPTAGDQSSNNCDALSLLEGGAEQSSLLSVTMEAEITKSSIGMYMCLCSITITPSADTDDGALLVVEVEHASLQWPVSVHRILSVYEGKPFLSDIIGDQWITHMNWTNVCFQITEFKPKKIQINLYLKRRNDIKKHLLHSWVSVEDPSDEDSTGAGHQNGDEIEEDPLLEDAVYHTMLPMEMEAEIIEEEDGSYKCDCRISLTPNADTDDGAVLIVEVIHVALDWPIYKYHILNVIKGDEPSLWRQWRRRIMHIYDKVSNIL